MIKCAIIGYGKMGKIRHHAIEQSRYDAIVTKVYDPGMDENDFPEGIDCATEDEIFNDAEIDAIFVCAPNYLIPKYCIQGLESGKNIFSEKPPGLCSKDVEDVIEFERKAVGKILMYGFNHRHHESIKKMKGIVDSCEIGKILWMRGRYGKEVDNAFFKGWRADPKLAGGGILIDQGIHMLDLLLHLGGGFDEVSAYVSNLFWKIPGIEDNVFAIYKNSESGVCASMHSTMTQWRYLFSLEIFLEGGALILNGLKTSSGAYGDEILTIKRNPSHYLDGRYEEEVRIVYHTDTSWESEVNDFFQSIVERVPVLLGNSSDALSVMKLIDMTYSKG